MQPVDFTSISTDPLELPLFRSKELRADVLRLDRMHPQVSGNKWFKLQYYLDTAIREGSNTLVTFGGAWSNHILATAAACRMQQLRCAGIIRGEEPARLSHTLAAARQLGMELYFISREAYRAKFIPGALREPGCLLVPEGGYGPPGAAGAATILQYCNVDAYTHFCCAGGTGTMAAGLLQAAPPGTTVSVISVLKNHHGLEKDIRHLCPQASARLQVVHGYHFGGYAKHPPELLACMNDWFRQTSIPADIVYTGKLFSAVLALAQEDFFPPGSRLLLLHSGGLQGNDSLRKGTLIF